MKAIRTALLSLYSAWAYSTFFLMGFVTAIYFAIVVTLFRKNPGPKLYRWIYWYSQTWGFINGMRYEVTGREYFQKDQAYVITSNHRGIADMFMMTTALKHVDYRPLSKIELRYVPLFGYLFSKTLIFIDRKSPESRQRGVDIIKKLIKEDNISPLIFPEGTRNRTDKPLKEFYDGAFRIAIECQVPVVPMVMLNIDAITPQGSNLIHPGKLYCRFFPPIPTEGLTLDDVEALKQQVFELMWQETEKFIAEHGNR